MSWHYSVSINCSNWRRKKNCPTVANQLRNVCHRKHRYFRHYKGNTWNWIYTFIYFSQNTKKKLVRSIKTWTLLCKNWSLSVETLTTDLCHPRNSWLSNKNITLNLHTANWNLFKMVTLLTIMHENAKITYQWKVFNLSDATLFWSKLKNGTWLKLKIHSPLLVGTLFKEKVGAKHCG